MKILSLVPLTVLVGFCKLLSCSGHGMMTTPRSRNEFASEEGVNDIAGLPRKEYCSHCLNTNTGVCGRSPNGNNYDDDVDSMGAPMPWISQETYTEGDVITVKSFMSTHHNGHMEMWACPDGKSSTLDCFFFKSDPNQLTGDRQLTFVKDELYGMPADPAYPGRGYYAGGQSGGLDTFEMLFRLPLGVYGDKVLLHWRYITANSCSPPGYSDYFSINGLPSEYWTSGLGLCTVPYNNDGATGSGLPEQFFNCAEVTILPQSPTISPAPTASPVTAAPTKTSAPVAAPTTPAPWTSSTNCCTQKFDECISWIGTAQGECQNAAGYGTDLFWHTVLHGTNCAKRWDLCTVGSMNQCCTGLKCEAQSNSCGYGQCVVDPSQVGVTAPGTMCCADIGKSVCRSHSDLYCNESQANCEGNCQGDYIVAG